MPIKAILLLTFILKDPVDSSIRLGQNTMNPWVIFGFIKISHNIFQNITQYFSKYHTIFFKISHNIFFGDSLSFGRRIACISFNRPHNVSLTFWFYNSPSFPRLNPVQIGQFPTKWAHTNFSQIAGRNFERNIWILVATAGQLSLEL